MGPCHPGRYVVEKSTQVGGNPGLPIVLRHCREILRARLLADPQHFAQPLRQGCQSRRYDVAQRPRALTTANYQQLDWPVGFRCLIAGIANRQDRAPHGVSGMYDADAVGEAQAGSRGKTSGDAPGARRQQPIGAAEHGILLVNQGRYSKMGRRQHRRNRRVTTKADDDGRLQSTQQLTRLDHTKCQFGEPSDGSTRCATELSRPDTMDFGPRETSGHNIGSPVAREMDSNPTAHQFVRQRLRGEQMATGPTRGQQECDAHGAVPESRRRVSASIIPMPRPSATKDDPPYERKGSVIPLVGIKCKLDAMFIAA